MATIKEKIIDVSKHNGTIDFDKVKQSGVYGVIIRAGYGKYVSQKDPKFEENYKKAKNAGLHVGAYWYSYALDTTDALAEANACLTVIDGKTFDLPIYFDIEESKNQQLSKDTNTAIVKTFCDFLEYEGYFVGVYSFDSFFANHLNYDELKNKYTLWVARWPSQDDGKTVVAPKYATTYAMHQYSAKGTVAGISGAVDLNIVTRNFPTIIRKNELNGYQGTTDIYHCSIKLENITAAQLTTLQNYLYKQSYKFTITDKTEIYD